MQPKRKPLPLAQPIPPRFRLSRTQALSRSLALKSRSTHKKLFLSIRSWLNRSRLSFVFLNRSLLPIFPGKRRGKRKRNLTCLRFSSKPRLSLLSSTTYMSRRLRAFKRWMKSYGIVYRDALKFVDSTDGGISVRVLCDLMEGDLVGTIPKISCLTIPTSGISSLIEDAGHGDLDASQFFSTQLFANIHRFSEAAI